MARFRLGADRVRPHRRAREDCGSRRSGRTERGIFERSMVRVMHATGRWGWISRDIVTKGKLRAMLGGESAGGGRGMLEYACTGGGIGQVSQETRLANTEAAEGQRAMSG